MLSWMSFFIKTGKRVSHSNALLGHYPPDAERLLFLPDENKVFDSLLTRRKA